MTPTRCSKTFGGPRLGEAPSASICKGWFRWLSLFIMSRALTLSAHDLFWIEPVATWLAPRTHSRNSILRACVPSLRIGSNTLPKYVLDARACGLRFPASSCVAAQGGGRLLKFRRSEAHIFNDRPGCRTRIHPPARLASPIRGHSRGRPRCHYARVRFAGVHSWPRGGGARARNRRPHRSCRSCGVRIGNGGPLACAGRCRRKAWRLRHHHGIQFLRVRERHCACRGNANLRGCRSRNTEPRPCPRP